MPTQLYSQLKARPTAEAFSYLQGNILRRRVDAGNHR